MNHLFTVRTTNVNKPLTSEKSINVKREKEQPLQSTKINKRIWALYQGMLFPVSYSFALRKRKRLIKKHHVRGDGNDSVFSVWALKNEKGVDDLICKLYTRVKPSNIFVSALHIFDDNKEHSTAPIFCHCTLHSVLAKVISIPKLIVDRITSALFFNIKLLFLYRIMNRNGYSYYAYIYIF